MKKYPQCMMCAHATGRRCNLKGCTVPDEIYSNEVSCKDFKNISDEALDCDDACCSENIRYHQEMKKFED